MMEDIICEMTKTYEDDRQSEPLTITLSEFERGKYIVHSDRDEIADGVFSVYKDAQNHLHGLVGHYSLQGFRLQAKPEADDD